MACKSTNYHPIDLCQELALTSSQISRFLQFQDLLWQLPHSEDPKISHSLY